MDSSSQPQRKKRKRDTHLCDECDEEFPHTSFYRHQDYHQLLLSYNQQQICDDEIFTRNESSSDCSSTSSLFTVSSDDNNEYVESTCTNENYVEGTTTTDYEIDNHEQLDTFSTYNSYVLHGFVT